MLNGPLCVRCGGPWTSPSCACEGLVGFARARSLVVFAEPARALTLAVKRRGTSAASRAIGSLLAGLCRREGLDPDVVTFVPGGRASALRGFDHAELIATAAGHQLGVSVGKLLRRTREGPRQADVPLAARRSNVSGRFAARRAAGRVLIVDDVFTTGATAEACALALTAAGADSVDVVTWARTVLRQHP